MSISEGSGSLVSFQHRGLTEVVRASLHYYNTEQEIDYVLEKLPPVVDRLRALSPIWGKEIPEYEEDVCR